MGTHARTRLPACRRRNKNLLEREFSFPALKPVVEVAIRMAGLLLPFERG